MRIISTLDGIDIVEKDDGSVTWTTGMKICADGANGAGVSKRAAYRPDNTGLDFNANAGYPHHPEWYRNILVCVNGVPVRQKANDPDPNAFISMTAYTWADKAKTDPSRYVDADDVAYIVVPPIVRMAVSGVVMGCHGVLRNLETGRTIRAVVAEIGPRTKIGEASMAAARALSINPSPKYGGTERKIIRYTIYPGIRATVNGVRYPLIPA